MRPYLIALGTAVIVGIGLWAADEKPADKPAVDESKIVAKTREKLTQKLDIDWKDTGFKDCVKELEDKLEVKFMPFGPGVSLNQNVTYSGKDKPAKDILHTVFKERGLGYIIHRKTKEGDRYEGWIQVVQGEERGDEITKKDAAASRTSAKGAAKTPPKVDAPPKTDAPINDDEKNEKLALTKLKQAKSFLEDGQKTDAKEFCEQIIKKYPKTKAAAEAKELLEKLKK